MKSIKNEIDINKYLDIFLLDIEQDYYHTIWIQWLTDYGYVIQWANLIGDQTWMQEFYPVDILVDEIHEITQKLKEINEFNKE